MTHVIRKNRSLPKTILIITITMFVTSLLLFFILDKIENFSKMQIFLIIFLTLEMFGFFNICLIKRLVLFPLVNNIYKNKKAAEIDQMTGICNRNKFIRRIELYNEYDSIGVIYFDLNNLKQTNDSYGHAAGDKLIIAVADVLKNFRNYLNEQHMDYYRMGGDEFLVVLPNIKEEEKLLEIQHKLLERMYQKKLHNYPNLKISVAYGSAYTDYFVDIEQLTNIADKKMYKNKKVDKN